MLSALERIHRRGWVSVLHGCCIGLVFGPSLTGCAH